MSASPSLGQIVTFYSWKGGVGRTMALANVALQLARKGKRVLVVDWDLEAPGLDRYFLVGEGSAKLAATFPKDASGLIGLLVDAMAIGEGIPDTNAWESRLHHFVIPPDVPNSLRISTHKPSSLHLLSSGLGTEGYGGRVAEFSWVDFFANANGGEWLERLREQWRERFDFVLIDSRTGLTDSGGVCTVQMPDILVLVFTSNGQSLEDGLKFIQSVQRNRRSFAYDRAPLAVLPLLSRWDGDDEVDLGVEWLAHMDLALRGITSSWLPCDFTPRQFLEKVRVPHVARFSFGEPLPVITHSLSDANLPGLAYECVALLLASNFGSVGKIIDPSYEPPRYNAGYSEPDELQLLALVQDPIALHREIARISTKHGSQSKELATFATNSGLILDRIGRYADAERLFRRALAIGEANYAADDPIIAIYLNNLAQLLLATNRMAEAEPMMRRALAIDEQAFHPDHTEVAGDLNNLAQLLRATNRSGEAEPLMRRALAIVERSPDLDQRKLSTALNNLAQLLHDTSRFAEAEPLMRRVLSIDENAFGPDHPEVATALNNLAGLLHATNRLVEAEPLFRRAMSIYELAFGPDHPEVAKSLNNLAGLLQSSNRAEEAEMLIRRALGIYENALGESHHEVATVLNSLAQLLKNTDRVDEAEPLMRRALSIDEQVFGSDHPAVAIRLNNLAGLLADTNRKDEAELILRRALAIDERSVGPDHPKVAIRLNNLAVLLKDTNRVDEAEPLMRRALSIDERAFGSDHPTVAIRLNNLAGMLMVTNRQAEIEPMMRRAVEILLRFTKTTGHTHPHLNSAVMGYNRLLEITGRTRQQIQTALDEVGRPFGIDLRKIGR